jgi:uncharacterized membrane protein YhiD involved in acid resistance
MNPISLLTTAVDNLWMWTYGLVAGWGVTVTLLIAALIFVVVRMLRLHQRVARLENRLIAAERDYNITLTKWQK